MEYKKHIEHAKQLKMSQAKIRYQRNKLEHQYESIGKKRQLPKRLAERKAQFNAKQTAEYEAIKPQIKEIEKEVEIFELWLEDDTLTPNMASDIKHDLQDFDLQLWMMKGKIPKGVRGTLCISKNIQNRVVLALAKVDELIGS